MVGTINLIGKKLNYLAGKTNVIAQNISRAEVPGYQRMDVKPFKEVLKNQKGKGLHLQSSDVVQTNHEVLPEYEMNKLNTVYMDHQFLINQIKTMYGMMDNVMGTKS